MQIQLIRSKLSTARTQTFFGFKALRRATIRSSVEPCQGTWSQACLLAAHKSNLGSDSLSGDPAADEQRDEVQYDAMVQAADASAATSSAQQQNGSGSSLPSSLAMTSGPSIGGLISTVKKLFGFGKAAKDTLDAEEQYSFWGKMQEFHLKKLQRDMGNSKYA